MFQNLKTWEVLLFLTVLRIASVFLVQTWYVPDEYWQSLEVAHKQVFGYGHLTWEWKSGIRSYIHPGLISILYKFLDILSLDNTYLLIFLPRVFQALLSVYSDYSFYLWSGRSKWALFSISTAWFWFYIGSRTLINSFETAVTTIALTKFPWVPYSPDQKPGDSKTFISLVGLICAMRPTACIIWLPLCVYHVLTAHEPILRTIIVRYLPIVALTLTISTAIDSFMHGSFILTWYEFLKLNVLENISDFYGTHPWHWYLSQGFAVVLGVHTSPFLLAAVHILRHRETYPNQLVMLFTVAFTITVYSFLPHKEFRFIAGVLPICLFISSQYLSRWSKKANITLVWLVASVLFVGNLIPAYYLSLTHQRGTLDVMTPLAKIARDNPKETSILFLMPCHSTPLYSHLHTNVTTRFLKCNPNLGHVDGYVTEVQNFYDNPSVWIRNNYPNREVGSEDKLPSHIVAFDNLVPRLSDILSRYHPLQRIFHTHIPLNSQIGNYVTIHERTRFPKKQ